MTLSADYIKPTRAKSLFFKRRNLSRNAGHFDVIASAGSQPHFQITAQLNIGAAPCHIGGNRHRTRHPGIGNNFSLFLMETGI